jgi:hypothetical protein
MLAFGEPFDQFRGMNRLGNKFKFVTSRLVLASHRTPGRERNRSDRLGCHYHAVRTWEDTGRDRRQ